MAIFNSYVKLPEGNRQINRQSGWLIPKNHQSSAVASATANVSQESLRSLTLLVAGLVPRLKAGARLLTWYGARNFAVERRKVHDSTQH